MEAMEKGEINLLDFPDEILLQVFCYLNDSSLLHNAGVCQRFKIIAREAFSKIYNGASETKYYEMNVSSEYLTAERKQYQPLLCTFGENITAIEINFGGQQVVSKNHWLIPLVQRYCKSITKVTIKNGKQVDLTNIILFMTKITHLHLNHLSCLDLKWTECNYPKMTHFSAKHVLKVNNVKFKIFINNNRQLQDLTLVHIFQKSNDFLCTLSDTLKQLQSLFLIDINGDFAVTSFVWKMDNLKTLTIKIKENCFVSLLTAIRNGCKNIEELSILNFGDILLDDMHINVICAFDKLRVLELNGSELSIEQLQVLVRRLPNLISMSIEDDAENYCGTRDDLLTVVSTCLKLSHLTLTVNMDLPMPIVDYEFYTRFAYIILSNESSLKFQIISPPEHIIFKWDEARLFKESALTQTILYWKGHNECYNLSDKNLLELSEEILLHITGYLDGNTLYAFYKTCKQTENLVKKHLSQNVFHCWINPTKCIYDNVIMGLGKHIFRIQLKVEFYFDDDEEAEWKKINLLEDINKYCKNLVEMVINNQVMNGTMLSWPNLKKLTFYFCVIDSLTLEKFHCPKLTQLKISNYEVDAIDVPIDWADSYKNITSLKFEVYNEDVEKFLYGMEQSICGQLKELSLNGSNQWFEKNRRRCWINLNYIITRCRQLVVLHLYLKGIQESNFKFLFEHCSKLVELSIYCAYDYYSSKTSYLEMFRIIKLNCQQIKAINFVGNSKDFVPSLLQEIYSTFPKTKINFIDIQVPTRNCLCTLNKANF